MIGLVILAFLGPQIPRHESPSLAFRRARQLRTGVEWLSSTETL